MEMDAFDKDRNRRLDYREFSKLVREREIGIHTEEALRKRFKSLDTDGSGKLCASTTQPFWFLHAGEEPLI